MTCRYARRWAMKMLPLLVAYIAGGHAHNSRRRQALCLLSAARYRPSSRRRPALPRHAEPCRNEDTARRGSIRLFRARSRCTHLQHAAFARKPMAGRFRASSAAAHERAAGARAMLAEVSRCRRHLLHADKMGKVSHFSAWRRR